MKPIHFRGQNYDPMMLQRLQGQGHRQMVATSDIITIAANPSFEARIAVQVEGKFHLLTGAIDKAVVQNELYVVSKPVLKKALVEPSTYAERAQDSRDHKAHRASSGFNDFRGGAGWR